MTVNTQIPETPETALLSMRNIEKVYSNGIVANKNVNFDVYKGEIHALAGENGAGKSTLMKVLFGIERADKGKIYYKGKEIHFANPLEAIEAGIGMVQQNFMLVPSLSVAENLVLGLEPKKGGLFSLSQAINETEKISNKYNLPINPKAIVRDLSVGLKQRLEILKALYRGADLLILDEPTSVLTPQETVDIFRELKELRQLGHTIIFISHKLNEIKEICDRITILRDGTTINTINVNDITERQISEMMVGREIGPTQIKNHIPRTEKALIVKDLVYFNDQNERVLNHISFDVFKGEIVGIAGIEGNGQNELSEIISGLIKPDNGQVLINNEGIDALSIREIREKGLSHISQDRMTYGVAGSASISDNLIADRYYQNSFGKGALFNGAKVKELASKLIKDFKIKCDSANQSVNMLSGGNIQKVVVAREFSSDPVIVVANQPTRGIDIGASTLVRNEILEMRKQHKGILLISADLTELFELSDRIIVIYKGEIVAHFPDPSQITTIDVGEYMLGLKRMDATELLEKSYVNQ